MDVVDVHADNASDDEVFVSSSSTVAGGADGAKDVVPSASCESFQSAVTNLDIPISQQATTSAVSARSRSRSFSPQPPRKSAETLPSVIRRRSSTASGGSPSRPIETSPLPPLSTDSPVDRALAECERFPSVPPKYFIEALKFGGPKETADRCLEFVKRMPIRNNRDAGRNLNVVLRTLEGESETHFINGFINDSPFGLGRLNSLAMLGFCRVSPFIICDALIFQKTAKYNLEPVVKRIKTDRPEELEAVLLFLLSNCDDPEAIHGKLTSIELFANLTVQQVASSFKPDAVHGFVLRILELANQPMSLEIKKKMIVFNVERFVVLHYRHEVELRDFYNYIMELVAGDRATLLPIVLDMLDSRHPAASSYIAKQEDLPPRAVDAVAETYECKKNDNFHGYTVRNEIVIESSNQLRSFYDHLDNSPKGIVVDVHTAALTLDLNKSSIGLITFGLKNATFFFMPKVVPEVAARIGSALRRCDPLVVAYRYSVWGKQFEDLLDWSPSRIVQIEGTAKSINVGQSLEAIAHHMSGGPYCRRASGISSTATPTSMALHHKSLRASMFWKFYVSVFLLSPSSSVADRRASSRRNSDDSNQSRLAAEVSLDRRTDRRADDSRQRRPTAEVGTDRHADRSRSSYRDSSSREHRRVSPTHDREQRHRDDSQHGRHRDDRDRRRGDRHRDDHRHENRGHSSRHRDDRQRSPPSRDRGHSSSSGHRRY